jgi:hypothetical protein
MLIKGCNPAMIQFTIMYGERVSISKTVGYTKNHRLEIDDKRLQGW